MKQRRRPRRTARRAAQQRNRVIIIGGAVLAALLIAFLGYYLKMSSVVNKVSENVICEHVFIDTVNVSGMNEKEAKAAIEEKLNEYKAMKLTLVADEAKLDATLGEIGFEMKDTEKLVKEAVSYGKEGGVFMRYSVIKELSEDNPVILKTVYSVDAKAVEKTVAEKMPELDNAAKNATITRANGAFVITDDKKGVAVDAVKSADVIQTYLNDKWTKQSGNSIGLVTKIDEPKVTREQLENVKDLLGTYTTTCGTGGGRVQNIITGAKHINGAVLMPGDEYSANAAMEPYTFENGYAEAGSYENGKVVQSMGGGICQVSSTLYNAVILSELEIVERAAHSMLVSYVEPSMDAAIAGDFKDLKFKNNTEFPIYIEAYVSGGKITFNVYGKETRPATRKVAFESEVISSTPAGEKFIASGDPVGTIKKASSGYTGMKTKLWKVVYENGVEVSRKVVNNSTYAASAAVYHVGTATNNPQAAAIVGNAIPSNNRATIQAAVAQAQAVIDAANAPAPTPEPTPGSTTPGATTPDSGAQEPTP